MAGIVIGVIASLAFTRLMSSMLFQVRSMDPVTIAVMSAVVMATALLASFIPARRATRIDPMAALRIEAAAGGCYALLSCATSHL